MSELQIIENLKKGNEPAFKQLVQDYQKKVVNTCYGMVHNMEDAEDIAQEVFIEIFRSIHKFRSDSKLSTWIYRIAINRSLNFIRDNKRKNWFLSFEDSLQSKNVIHKNLQNKNTDDPAYKLENTQRANILHETIGNLPTNQKIAFTLNKYEDLSYQEISEVMNVSVSSVESLLFRAKKNLQKKLYKCYKKKCF